MLFRAQREFDHPLEKLVGRQADEVSQDQFLGIKAHEVTQLEGLVPPRINEIPMAIVNSHALAPGILKFPL